MKSTWIFALLLVVSLSHAQMWFVDSIQVFFRDFVNAARIGITDIAGSQSDKVSVRTEVKGELQAELGNSRSAEERQDVQAKIDGIRAEIGQIIQESSSGEAAIIKSGASEPWIVAATEIQLTASASAWEKISVELATKLCKENLDSNCVCGMVSATENVKSFDCTNGNIQGSGSCLKDTGMCSASAGGITQEFAITKYVK